MRKLVLSLAMVTVTFAFAQKKEIASAVKAVESGDHATATAQVAAAESAFGGQTHLLEPALLEQYYYAKGLALIKAGKTSEGASVLSKISDLASSKIYTGKDGKTKVYFVGKAAADASGISGLKEESYTPSLTPKVISAVNPLVQNANKAAVDAYNAKNYAVAGPKFREVYNLLKAAGQNNKQYLYYSAITYALGNDKAKAIETYNELIDSGYTGVETKYLAKNKKTGQMEELEKSAWDLMKKAGATGDYTDFKTETSKSVELEIYETNVGLMMESEKYTEAIALANKGLEKFPASTRLSELRGLAYYKSGKTEEFVASLKEQVAKNPNDRDSWYNLGVLASKDPSKYSEAEGYFKKALEIDPKYALAYQNLTYMAMDLDNDQKHIDKYNELRKAGKADEANKIIEARRARFAKALPYAEKWYEADPKNVDAVSLLKSLYQSTNNEAKAKEFREKEAAMKK
ncbi:tetratricopeptide repeat protein [Bergeyella sp. RCAD1439]|uniref:tetratricopeptide repeat protein n=1 Tax=Bergeyella anatis TaxID=3113737 RepID=UPI002E19F3BE|nr:tetratricopeptide repeat protein [Bergeyella sp. RCAD1439]